MLTKYEFTIKSKSQLQSCLDKLTSSSVPSICLTDKKANLSCFELIPSLRQARANIKITTNYSLTNHYSRKPHQVLEDFQSFMAQAKALEVEEVLLVSGNPKRKIETISALGQASRSKTKTRLAVAFNPFADLQVEVPRLAQKLSFEDVKSVYLQLGDDLRMLHAGICQIKKIQPLASIWLSILVPSPQKLHSLRFRPWHGVKFSQEFLQDLQFAKNKNRQLKQLAKDHSCNILFS